MQIGLKQPGLLLNFILLTNSWSKMVHFGDVGKTLEIWFLGSSIRDYEKEGGRDVDCQCPL